MALSEERLDCWTFGGWETDRQYKRMGARAALFTGDGAWVSAWRRRVVSSETARMLAESGVTIVMTHFYKGFGVRAEASEWPRLKEMVKLYHAQGIRVLGYMQGRSIYYETLKAERPDLDDWVGRRYDGQPHTWGGCYYRLGPCLTSRAYLDYMKEVVRLGMAEIGLDGIHNDNSYYPHCWCKRCAALFRGWLNAMPDLEARTGLPNADHVLPPPLADDWTRYDPLQIAWMEFGTRNRFRALGELYATMKSNRPDGVYEQNPAFPKKGPYKARLAVDPAREGAVCDVVCAENSNLPRVEKGVVISQAEAYLHGDAGRYRVLNTTWNHDGDGMKPADTPGLLWAGLAEEFSYHAALLGNNWLLRPTADGAGVLADNAALRRCHADATRFFQALHRDLRLGARRQWAEAAIYIDPDTLTLGGGPDLNAVRALVGWALAARVPVCFVYGGQAVPESVTALFVCQQTCLSDARLAEIAAWGAGPGRQVFVMGSSGRHDEWGVPRDESPWRAWRGSPGFVADSGARLAWPETVPLSGESEPRKATESLIASSGWKRRFEAFLPGGALVNVEQAQDGRLLIHLRDQGATEAVVNGARVWLAEGLARGKAWAMWTPDGRGIVKTREKGGGVEAEAGDFRRYALLVLE